METVDTQTPPQTSEPTQKEISILNVPVSDQNIALNVMVFFLNSAQRRGAFSIDESAKLWEAVKMFVPVTEQPTENTEPSVTETSN
tara:strand:+ start:611 stop:868 length:258 start_codon:yes stop_codon:yes gene_type:complete